MPFFRKMAKKKENKIPPKIRPLVKPQNHLIVLPLIPIDAVSKKVLTLDEVSKFKKKDQEVYRQKKKRDAPAGWRRIPRGTGPERT